MATGKRYYWIKLRESFMTSDAVDFLMGQKGGADYVVLYQMLCLKTINNGGRLSRTIGEIIIPYDIEKIQRDCKWFTSDTVRVALTLFKSLGLVYEDNDGILSLVNYKSLVGSETDYAGKKRKQRKKQSRPLLPESGDIGGDIVPTDIDKDIDIDSSIEECDAHAHAREEKRVYGEYQNVYLTDEEYQTLSSEFTDLGKRIERLSTYLKTSGRGYDSHFAIIRQWAREDAEKATERGEGAVASSFDADEFFEAALRQTYGEGEKA